MKHLLFVSAFLFVTPAWSQAIVVATCGSGAYTVGQLHQLTMNPAGYLCVSTTTTRSATDDTASGKPAETAPHALGARPPGDEPRPPTSPPEPKK
jgi:hypothetical protein